jgi:HSP20 family molecular chaperone IbpA
MLATYGLILPTALAPPVEVPLDLDSPSAMEGEPSKRTAPSEDREKDGAVAPPSQQHNLETKPSFISHSDRHHHVNLSNMMHNFHLPTFHGYNHLPHMTLPNLTWPHLIAQSTPVYTTTVTSWGPPADIRETESAYFVEIEVPGLKAGDADQVLVQWMSPRTIVVSGDVQRAPLPALPREAPKSESEGSNGEQEFVKVASPPARNKDAAEDLAPSERAPSAERCDGAQPEDRNAPASKFLICERHVGYWRRSFTLPADVDLDVDPSRNSSGRPLEYKIEAGVLRIRAPKVKK